MTGAPIDPGIRLTRGSLGAILAALVVGVFVLSRSDENAIGAYGLIQALPITYFIAVFVILGVLINALRWRRQPTAVMSTGLVSLFVLVHGSAVLMESEARFPVAWLHASFAESIISMGNTTPSLDARFSWPGFFSGAAALTELTGVSSPAVWLKLAPIVLPLCYLPLLLAIGRATLKGWRAPWIGVVVFVMSDWVGQGYFAPQTVAYIIYLAFVAIVLTYLRRRDPGRLSVAAQGWSSRAPRGLGWFGSIVRSSDRDGEPAEFVADPAMRIGLLALLAGLTFALVSSHQLTPVILIVTLAALAVLGRLRPWPIVAFVGVAMLGWLSYGAEPFWIGHLSQIFGGIGQVDAIVGSGVSERLRGSEAHLLVLDVRIVFALLVWGLAAFGAWRLWRVGRTVSVALLVLTLAPGFLIVAQSYGGEGLLRVFFFSLPGAAMLIAGLVSPRPSPPNARTLTALLVAITLSFPLFLIAKWGNEDFERISSQDLQLRQEVHQLAPPGSTIVDLGYGGPVSYQGLTAYNKINLVPDSWPIADVAKVNELIGANPIGTYIVIMRPQVAYGVENDGLSPQFAEQLVAMLIASKQYQIVFQNSSGVILEKVAPKPLSPGPPAGAVGPVSPVELQSSRSQP